MVDYSRSEVAIGAVVLAVAVGFAVYAGQITGWTNGAQTYVLNATFRSLDGVSVGTDVRLAGVKIGTVTDMSLNADTYHVDAIFDISNRVAIPDDSAVMISAEGVLGGSFVEIIPGGSPVFLAEGDEILDTQGSVSLLNLLLKFVGREGASQSE